MTSVEAEFHHGLKQICCGIWVQIRTVQKRRARERVEGEMSDASDSDDVSKRLELKNSGSRVDTSDSDEV